jgi:hypothetical protein
MFENLLHAETVNGDEFCDLVPPSMVASLPIFTDQRGQPALPYIAWRSSLAALYHISQALHSKE